MSSDFLDGVVAIDMHTHATRSTRNPPDEVAIAIDAAMDAYFKQSLPRPTIDETAAYYRERRIGLDRVADGHHLMGVDVVLDGQLAGGDHTLGLVADVEEDLVAVHLDDGAVDHRVFEIGIFS